MIQSMDENGDGLINADALVIFCDNIGASRTITRSEIEQLIIELGEGGNTIGAKTV